MSNFSNNSITNNGRALLADVMVGAVFTPTRIAMGSGKLPVGTSPQNIAALVSPVKNLDIVKKERTPDGKFIVGGVYSNADVTEAFYFRELALFAKAVFLNADGSISREGDEVLYSYGNAGDDADLMPAYSTSTVVERMLDLVTWVGNEAAVDLTIASGIYASAADLKALEAVVLGLPSTVEAVRNAVTAHTNNKSNPHGVTAAQVGARPSTWTPTPAQVGAVAKTGDTMTGALTINKATPWGQIIMNAENNHYRSFETDGSRMRLDVRGGRDVTHRHYLDLCDPEILDFATALRWCMVGVGPDGKTFTKNETVFHTGNVDLIDPTLFSGCKVETGSYVGTGTYGDKNPTSITFTKGTPILVIIQRGPTGTGIFVPGSGGGVFMNKSVVQDLVSTMDGQTMKWHNASSAAYQMNDNGVTYKYTAFVV